MEADRRRPRWLLAVILVLSSLLCAGFLALGIWQMQRLAWKRDLIARVEARVTAPAMPLAELLQMPPARREYRNVTVTGRFDNSAETFVKAVTELGGGYWLLTPLRSDDGLTVFVNRGFVPPEKRDPATRPDGQLSGTVTVTGLARLSEPGGAFLRDNDSGADRWFSRDIDAMAQARGISPPLADIFIDADASPIPGGYPVGGLTVIRFRNTHLSYALTWFALAAMMAGGMAILLRHERLQQRDQSPTAGT